MSKKSEKFMILYESYKIVLAKFEKCRYNLDIKFYSEEKSQ